MRSFSRRVDLTSIIGLETCIHPGPSIIDHRTLQNSKQLPLSFLRGIGLPDSLIAYLPSLLTHSSSGRLPLRAGSLAMRGLQSGGRVPSGKISCEVRSGNLA